MFLISSYRTICKATLTSADGFASLNLALWGMLPIYKTTTYDFGKGEVKWLALLLAAITAPRRVEDRAPTVRRVDSNFAGHALGF